METQAQPQTEETTKVKRSNYYLGKITQSFASKRELIAYLNANNGLEKDLTIIKGLEAQPETKQVFDIN